jgi:hypothetical protein
VVFKFDRPHNFEKLDADRPTGLAQVHLFSPQDWFKVGQPQELNAGPHRYEVPFFKLVSYDIRIVYC